MNADLILFNGQFHTVDRENPSANARPHNSDDAAHQAGTSACGCSERSHA